MTSENEICRLCFNTCEKKEIQIVNDSEVKMLEALGINLDLSIGKNCLICGVCRKKLEQHFNFKDKCIYTEKCISPFIVENVKLNLNETRNQIIKSEEDSNKNVCRLCLEFSDTDMTLSVKEQEQFINLIPELNFNATTFVVFCSTCYYTIQRYFIFVTSCTELQEQLKDYISKQKRENEVIDFAAFQNFMRNQQDEKFSRLNEELDIKCEMDYPRVPNVPLPIKMHRCGECNYQSKWKTCVDRHIRAKHTSSSEIEMYKCEKCSYESKWKRALGQHILLNHTDPVMVKIYKCEQCDYESKYRTNLKLHVLRKHSDFSQTQMKKCEQCDYQYITKDDLDDHIACKHTFPEITIHKCEQCNYQSKFKWMINKHMLKHADPSMVKMHKCEHCDYQSKYNHNLILHVQRKHPNLRQTQQIEEITPKRDRRRKGDLDQHVPFINFDPTIKIYKCDYCDYRSKGSTQMKFHILRKHTDHSQVQMYKCKKCNYQTVIKGDLRKHALIMHSSEIKMHKCDHCNYQSKKKGAVDHHIFLKHTDPLMIKMHECEHCDYKSKQRSHLKVHIMRKHTDKLERNC